MIYHDLTSNPKLFADETSLFSVVQNMNWTTTELNSDLSQISDGLSNGKWILILNLINKLKRKFLEEKHHPPLLFNQNFIESSSTQKHLRMVFDTKLEFNLKNVQSKVNKTIGLLHKLQNILLRKSLITNYKSL